MILFLMPYYVYLSHVCFCAFATLCYVMLCYVLLNVRNVVRVYGHKLADAFSTVVSTMYCWRPLQTGPDFNQSPFEFIQVIHASLVNTLLNQCPKSCSRLGLT